MEKRKLPSRLAVLRLSVGNLATDEVLGYINVVKKQLGWDNEFPYEGYELMVIPCRTGDTTLSFVDTVELRGVTT